MVIGNVKTYICLLFFIGVCSSQRRIKNGHQVETDKRYVVYLIKAPPSPKQYIGWLCGGAIVSEWYIISSAACVEDVEHLYAIAGYKKYVKPSEIDTDECTKDKKKKVVFTCVPKLYEFNYDKLEKWAHIDIAVIKVESPYDFNDQSYLSCCSYIPGKIEINYEGKYQEPGTDAMVLGWGHENKYRKEDDDNIYNTETLHYASALVIDKKKCKESYADYPNLIGTIDNYMICTYGIGNINDKGERIAKNVPKLDGCNREALNGQPPDETCNPYDGSYSTEDDQIDDAVITYINATLDLVDDNEGAKRRFDDPQSDTGICQNDHGGPLVTWVGAHEILIGVATAFKIAEDSTCIGPYLFTSTQCSGAFIDCIINSDSASSKRRARCENPRETGFEMIRRTISWVGHPAGPAANEMIQKRPQLPISVFNKGK